MLTALVSGYSRVPEPPASTIPFKPALRGCPTEPLSPIAARERGLAPPAVLQVPAHGLLQARLQRLLGPPAELAFYLPRVYGIASVVARPVRDEGDERLVRRSGDQRSSSAQMVLTTSRFVRSLWPPTLYVSPGRPRPEHSEDSPAVVLHVEPVPDVLPVAVDGQGFSSHGGQDHERYELLRKVVGPVVVRAVCGERGEPVSVVVGPHEMVGGRLGGGVGGVGPVRALLGKVALGPQRPVHLVRGDVQKAEGVVVLPFEVAPVGEHGLEEFVGLDHVGLYKGLRTVDGAVDVRLGGEVDDGRRTILGEQTVHQFPVPDPPLHEDVVWIIRNRGQCVWVAGVGQGVEIDHPVVPDRSKNEVAAYKAGAAGDEDSLLLSLQCAPLLYRFQVSGISCYLSPVAY